ncbi:hypothetical protein [Mycolicibacterium hodleri]|nr:hypothetical protein [Mycolicibacterium hodleri]
MTTEQHSYVDAEYQGLELGLRHADLANFVGLAAQWTRACQTAIPNDQFTDLDVVYPLKSYAAPLETVYAGLAAAVADLVASTHGPNVAIASAQDHVRQRRSDAHFPCRSDAHFPSDVEAVEAVQYLVGLEPRSRYRVTHQDLWRSSLAHAEDYLSSRGDVDAPELQLKLSRYATVVHDLLDAAYIAVRDAYADAVVASFYRKVPAPVLPYTIASCLKDLTCMGFDDANCEPLLRRIGESLPAAVAECSALLPHKWQSTPRCS